MDGFCSTCNETVRTQFLETEKEGKIRGKEITYRGKIAVCPVCKGVVEVPGLDDLNLDLMKEAFREKEGLISIEEIESILNRYKIGKRPLSLLLGWGEGTLTRYLNGDLPTRQYSATLRRINEDPTYYREILEDNRSAITYQAYVKSKKALELLGYSDSQMTMESICSESLENAAAYLLRADPGMDEKKLHIMLYYLQGFHMAFWRRELFTEEFSSVGNSPRLQQIIELFPTGKLHDQAKCIESSDFSPEEILLMDTIIHSLGRYQAQILEKWILSESFAFGGSRQSEGTYTDAGEHIEKENISEHFLKILSRFQMISVLDIKEYQRTYDRIT